MRHGLPKLTEEDRREMEEEKRRNTEERLKFVVFYAEWLKKTPNKVWSKQQVKYFGGGK